MDNHISPNILIIDDEQPILKLLSMILSRENFNIDTTNNGENGIKKIESNSYNLILTDIKMPGISGIEVLEYSKNTINKSTPVVGMSGTPWLLEEGLFDAILTKPFTKKDLFKAIHNLI